MAASQRAVASYTYIPQIFTLSSTTPGVIITGNGTQTATASLTTASGVTTITFNDPLLNPPKGVGTNSLNLGDLSVTTTATNASPATFNVTYIDNILITNSPSPGTAGTGNLAFTGTILLDGISFTTGIGSAGTVTQPNPATATIGSTTAGGVSFVINTLNFASPTVGIPRSGNIGADITAAAVPAPASIVMLGLGMGVMGLVRVRRRLAA